MNNLPSTRLLLKPISIIKPVPPKRPAFCAAHVPKRFGRRQLRGATPRLLSAFLLLVVSISFGGAQFGASAQTVIPTTDPNSVVPPAFRANASWSEEGGWHWVAESYDDTRRFTGTTYDYSVGKRLPRATYVATRVRTLSATDQCATCVPMSTGKQGPPVILGGSTNAALAPAYANLDNGPRRQIESTSGQPRWTNGAWYLNYNPASKKFFSWTWIPDDGRPGDGAVLSASSSQSLIGLGQFSLSQSVAAGSRVVPIAANFVISQLYGCVPLNTGYVQAPNCPTDRPSFHDGVDFAAPLGTAIVAAASGTVTFAGIDSASPSGNSKIIVRLDGANAGFETVYMHWERAYVKVGDHVSAGQVIAAVGSVGYSTGPHLHFAVLSSATQQTIDPMSWLLGAIELNIGAVQTEGAYSNVARWQALIEAAAQAHNVPAALIAAIMAVESSGNPTAISPAGAQGLMQIMPSELTRLGVPQDHWLDPAANIDAGARYLAESLSAGASIEDAAARYFGSGCDALGTCTAEYVNHVVVLYVYFDAWFSLGTPLIPTMTPFASTNVAPAPTQPATTAVATSSSNPATATPTSSPTTPSVAPDDATPPVAPSTATTSTPENATATPSPTAASTPTNSSAATETPQSSTTATTTTSPTEGATQTPAASPTPAETPEPTIAPAVTATVTPTTTPAAPTPQPSTGAMSRFNSGTNSACIVGPLLSELAPLVGIAPGPTTTGSGRGCTP